MAYELLAVEDLRVNQANDRHGELENETAAIAELFRLHDTQMRNLATDIAAEGSIYDPPLVAEIQGDLTVFDGNRRVTCLKLLRHPDRAPNQDLQAFFRAARESMLAPPPDEIMCQVEDDRDRVDAILYRRHTGSQGGVGQLIWRDRAKLNFVERTGRGAGVDAAVETERFLAAAGRLPAAQIPLSTLRRLLSSEENRNRVGVSLIRGHFRLTHDEQRVTEALARIADDLAGRRVTLGDLWDNRGKREYLARLEEAGVLPGEADRLPQPGRPNPRPQQRQRRAPPPPPRLTLIPADAPHIQWTGDQQRARSVWEELQSLRLDQHPNAISALLRILVELAVGGYIQVHNLQARDTLSTKVRVVADHLRARDAIDEQYRDELERLRQHDELLSIASMQRYIHSPNFAPLQNELVAYWTRLGAFLQAALSL